MGLMASQVTSITIFYSTVNIFRHRSKKTSKLRVTGLCEVNSLVTGEFPTQRASNTENVSIWWRHHDYRHRHCHIAVVIAIVMQLSWLWYFHYLICQYHCSQILAIGKPHHYMTGGVSWFKSRWRNFQICKSLCSVAWIAMKSIDYFRRHNSRNTKGTVDYQQRRSTVGVKWPS